MAGRFGDLNSQIDRTQKMITDTLGEQMSLSARRIYTQEVDRLQQILDTTQLERGDKEKILLELTSFFDVEIMSLLSADSQTHVEDMSQGLEYKLRELEGATAKSARDRQQQRPPSLNDRMYDIGLNREVESYLDDDFFDKHAEVLKVLFAPPKDQNTNKRFFDAEKQFWDAREWLKHSIEKEGQYAVRLIQMSDGGFDFRDFINLRTSPVIVDETDWVVCEEAFKLVKSHARMFNAGMIIGAENDKDRVRIGPEQISRLRKYIPLVEDVERQAGMAESGFWYLLGLSMTNKSPPHFSFEHLTDAKARVFIAEFLRKMEEWKSCDFGFFCEDRVGDACAIMEASMEPSADKLLQIIKGIPDGMDPNYIWSFLHLGTVFCPMKTTPEQRTDIVLKNQQFLAAICMKTGNVYSATNDQRFPMGLIEKHKDELMQIADAFLPATADYLLFHRIQNAHDLDFVLGHKAFFLEFERLNAKFFENTPLRHRGDKDKVYRASLIHLPSEFIIDRYGDKILDLVNRHVDAFASVVRKSKSAEIDSDTARELEKQINEFSSYWGGILEYLPNDLFMRKHGERLFSILDSSVGPSSIRSICLRAGLEEPLFDKHGDLIVDILRPFINMEERASALTILTMDLLDSHRDFLLEITRIPRVNAASLWSLPLELIQDYGEDLKWMMRNMGPDSCAQCFDQLQKEWRIFPDLRAAFAIVRKTRGHIGPNVFLMLAYWQYAGYPESEQERLITRLYSKVSDFSTDYRSTDSKVFGVDTKIFAGVDLRRFRGEDIRMFSLKKRDVYKKLFYALKVSGPDFTKLETDFIQQMDFSDFIKEMEGKNFLEAQRAVDDIANNIDPRLGEIAYKKLVLERLKTKGIIAGLLKPWYNAKTHKIDVTQNNLASVNLFLRALIGFKEMNGQMDISAELKTVFPNCPCRGDFKEDLGWLADQFDVEEINFEKLHGLGMLSEYVVLQNNMGVLRNLAAKRYLDNRFNQMDIMRFFQQSGDLTQVCCDIDKIEQLRLKFNAKDRLLGDQLVDRFGMQFLEQTKISFETLPLLFSFARAWAVTEASAIHHDVRGFYRQYANFAYDIIGGFLKSELKRLGQEGLQKALKKAGLVYQSAVNELASAGFSIAEAESDLAKGITYLTTQPLYVARKGIQKNQSGERPDILSGRVQAKENVSWSRKGVKVIELAVGGEEKAKVIKCDPRVISAEMLMERSGVVDMQGENKNLGGRLVFSAPVNMTTGDHKMTELAFRRGEPMNWLLNPASTDGFIVADTAGSVKILHKQRLKISDFIDAADLERRDVRRAVEHWLGVSDRAVADIRSVLDDDLRPVMRFADKALFFQLMRLKEYSLLCGMMVVDGGMPQPIRDGADSRRFFVEFNDGDFGIIDSSVNMGTKELADLAVESGVKNAVYMDTGMYDMATYKDGAGADHLMGHPDTAESTNRVVIYER